MCESRQVPYVERGRVIEPPNYQERFGALQALKPQEGLDLIRYATSQGNLTPGAAGLAAGLIREGLTMSYGTPEASVLGIDFSTFAKQPTVDQNMVGAANQQVATYANGVNAVVGIAQSGLPLMHEVGRLAGIQTITVDKQIGRGGVGDGDCAVIVPGFTTAGDKTFRYDLSQLYDALARTNGITLYQVLVMAKRDQLDLLIPPTVMLNEDIFHTGTVLTAIATLNERLWQSIGVRLSVTQIAAWFGMTYAGYDKAVKKTFGINPEPVLKIKSLGVEPEPWVELDTPGIDGYALTYQRSYKE